MATKKAAKKTASSTSTKGAGKKTHHLKGKPSNNPRPKPVTIRVSKTIQKTKDILRKQAKRTTIIEPTLMSKVRSHASANIRKEKFVTAVATGSKIGDAQRAAGVSAQTASEWVKSPEILQAVHDEKLTLAARLGITPERVLREYASLGFSNMLDYTRCNDSGEVFINLANLTREQAAAISEITVEEYVERKEGTEDQYERVKRTKFKLHPKEAALTKLGKHLGIRGFDSKLQLVGADDGPIQVSAMDNMTELQLDAMATQIEAELEMLESGK